jgi:hypothetical protein
MSRVANRIGVSVSNVVGNGNRKQLHERDFDCFGKVGGHCDDFREYPKWRLSLRHFNPNTENYS